MSKILSSQTQSGSARPNKFDVVFEIHTAAGKVMRWFKQHTDMSLFFQPESQSSISL